MAQQQSKTRVLLENDLEGNPSCIHGPMLLFSKELAGKSDRQEFFACSACRNPRECPGRLPGNEKDYQESNLSLHRDTYERQHKVRRIGAY